MKPGGATTLGCLGKAGSVALALVLSAGGCSNDPSEDAAADAHVSGPGTVDRARLLAADEEPGQWMAHGRTYDEQRFSPLSDINVQTVDSLGLAWHFDFDTQRGQEATPIVVDGVMYVSSAWSKVFALDASTGESIWAYDPKADPLQAAKACCDVVNRGVAVWDNKVFVGTIDGRLVALNAADGSVLWDVLTVDQDKAYTITGAPRVVDGKVFIGNGGAEFDVRGYVGAYDAESGELIWRFYTVPGNPEEGFEDEAMEKAAATWTGEWWTYGGGGTVWDSMAYDAELDLLYIGVGNGSPWNQAIRSPDGGDNLFLSSIVALRPDTGEYVWHYQTTPGETWDYTATQHIILADLEIDGELRQVLMQAPKNGFFYVLDRETGKLVSAEKFVAANWASHIDLETGRPVEHPQARFGNTGEPWLVNPGPFGAHNWQPMSYSAMTGLVYLPARELSQVYYGADAATPKGYAFNNGMGAPPDTAFVRELLANRTSVDHLAAWDPVTQQEIWRVQFQGTWNGGTLATAGNLVFQGTALGDLNAYNAETGALLWSSFAQTAIMAPPISYEVDDVEYVSVAVGTGGGYPLIAGDQAHKQEMPPSIGRVLTYRLDGDHSLPPAPVRTVNSSSAVAVTDDPSVLALGGQLYAEQCFRCHGREVTSGGVIADLRESPVASSAQAWASVVGEGVMLSRGMPPFGVSHGGPFSAGEIEAIRAYVVARSLAAPE